MHKCMKTELRLFALKYKVIHILLTHYSLKLILLSELLTIYCNVSLNSPDKIFVVLRKNRTYGSFNP